MINPADVLVGSQRRRQFFRRVHGLRHPDRGGVDAPMDKPGAEGVTGGTQQHGHRLDFVTQCLRGGDGTSDGIAVTV